MTVPVVGRKRIALVTGCGQGLGAEVARRLAQSDCIVLATYRKMPNPTATQHGVYHAEMDVTNLEQVRGVVSDAVSRFGAIDILVNNAGVYLDREVLPSLELLPLTLLQETLDVNLLGAARTMAEVTRVMIRQGSGVIVNVSSGMGRNVELAGDAIYYRTSKAALTALSRCTAKRLQGHGIVVNAVCPGWVRTRMGGQSAGRSIEQGAEGIVAAALDPRKNGVLLRDSEDFGW
jgi:NAD(P)-dependent dehydrogenase (short-subunit alcohol dehydrogenase family)